MHGATLSVVGFTMDKVEMRLSNLMAFDARALGNWGCPPEHYPAALDLVLDGKVQIEPFVETHPLHDINEVFEAVHQPRDQAPRDSHSDLTWRPDERLSEAASRGRLQEPRHRGRHLAHLA